MSNKRSFVEMRFLVPPDLVDSVREAMAVFPVEESAATRRRQRPRPGKNAPQLTDQELDLLLRG